MIVHLMDGLGQLGNLPAILILIAGSVVGVFIGVLPGFSGIVILSIALAFAQRLSLETILVMYLAVHGASFFSASLSSMLLNTPPHPEAFAVGLDGFPMSQKQQAGRAIGLSAASTALGGIIGGAIAIVLLLEINSLVRLVHSPEYVALVILVLVLVSSLGGSRNSTATKALMSGALGLLISSIGTSAITGQERFTFGMVSLNSGVQLVSVAIGLFVVSQMMIVYGTATAVASQDLLGREIDVTEVARLEKSFRRQAARGVVETFRHGVLLVQSALIGVLTGVVPGIGGFVANFASYTVAQRTSKNRQAFGTGAPEGIIAPEGSSLSKEAGQLIPLLGLGIPGGATGAIFLAMLAMKGITPGYGFVQRYPVVTYEMVWIIVFSGIVGSVAGVAGAPLLARLTRTPGPILLPFIMGFSIIGVIIATGDPFSFLELAIFGAIGFVLRRLGYSLAGVVVGVVLGPTLETNLYQAHVLYPGVSAFVKQPFAVLLLLAAVAVLAVQSKTVKRKLPHLRAGGSNGVEDRGSSVELGEIRSFATLGLVTRVVLVGAFGLALGYSLDKFTFASGLFPDVAAGAGLLAGLGGLAAEVKSFRAGRRVGPSPMLREFAVGSEVAISSPLMTGQSAQPLGNLQVVSATDLRSAEPRLLEASALKKSLPPISKWGWGWHGQYTRELACFGWICGTLLMIYLFGFVIGFAVFSIGYGAFGTSRVMVHWQSRVAMALCLLLVGCGGGEVLLNAVHIGFTSVF